MDKIHLMFQDEGRDDCRLGRLKIPHKQTNKQKAHIVAEAVYCAYAPERSSPWLAPKIA